MDTPSPLFGPPPRDEFAAGAGRHERGGEEEETGPEVPDEGGPGVGDLVILPVPRIRASVGCGERVGVVLEDRRNVVKVYFAEIDRAFWIDRGDVQTVAAGRLPTAPLAERLHAICATVAAVAVEFYDREGGADVFHVFTRGTTLDALLSLRASLGDDLVSLGVDPGGVRRTRLTLALRSGRAHRP